MTADQASAIFGEESRHVRGTTCSE
jgi:hypothetical protein